MISFQARYINSATIKHQTQPYEYQDMNTALVEFDFNSRADKRTIKKISKMWSKEFDNLEKQGFEMSGGTCLAKDIYKNYKATSKNPNFRKYYAMTSQTDHFEKLNPDNILGIAQISSEYVGTYDLENFQVKPEYTAFINNSKYTKIGTGFLNSILEVLPFKVFRVIPTINSAEFYNKYGLKYDPETITFGIIKEDL